MDKGRLRGPRTTLRHHMVIVQFLEEHPEMLTHKFKTANSRERYNENWQNLAVKLNALGEGTKTPTQWQKVLSDWICRIKAKVAHNKKYSCGTGGGPPKSNEISDIEQTLIQLKGMSCVEGDGITQEVGFGQIIIPEETSIHNTDSNKDIDITDNSIGQSDINRDHQTCRKRKVLSIDNKNERQNRSTLYLKMHKETLSVLCEISNTLKSVNNNFNSISTDLHQLNQTMTDIKDVLTELID